MSNKQIDCEQAIQQLYTYLDHELGEHDRHAMQHHLDACKSCFSRMEFERRLKEKVSELRDEDATESVKGRVKGLLKSF